MKRLFDIKSKMYWKFNTLTFFQAERIFNFIIEELIKREKQSFKQNKIVIKYLEDLLNKD